MGGTTLICDKCGEAVRVSSEYELTLFMAEHKLKCGGEIESLWKDYDKMTNEEKDKLTKQVMFRQGKLGKLTR